jgi:hypothetical protein
MMGAAVPPDHFATSTADTTIGGSPFAWDSSFDDKNQEGPETTGEPDAPAFRCKPGPNDRLALGKHQIL